MDSLVEWIVLEEAAGATQTKWCELSHPVVDYIGPKLRADVEVIWSVFAIVQGYRNAISYNITTNWYSPSLLSVEAVSTTFCDEV